MTITKAQLVSTGAALRHAEKHGVAADQVERVTLDGADVDAAAARAALAEAEQAHAESEKKKSETDQAEAQPAWWRRAVTGVTAGVSSTTGFLRRNVAEPTVQFLERNAPAVNRTGEALGAMAQNAVMSDPEDVARKAKVQITLKNGSTVDVPVVVVDDTAAAWLKATSVAAGGASLVPIFGNFVQGGTRLLCALASGGSWLLGDTDLARSLSGMAKKHVTLGLIGFVPGLGVITGVAAARDATRFQQGVPLDQLVERP